MHMDEKKLIMVVDDENRIREMLRMILENRGYRVIEAGDGQSAVTYARDLEPDLILLDIMMPVMDGIDSCRKMREFYEGPILMLTAKGEDYDQVNGLESGADDYIIKPFTPMVLAARVEAALRRHGTTDKNQKSFGGLIIDTNARVVKVEGQNIDMSLKEFDLLYYLADNSHISLSRDQILQSVWGYDYLGTESTVDTHINRLRKKLGSHSDYILTVRGYGYRFEVPDET